MRALVMIVATSALAGCTFKSTTVKQEPPPPAAVVAPAPTVVTPATPTVPRVTYTVFGEAQFNQAAVQAANWCRQNYSAGARLMDRQRTTAGDVVTFECVAG